MPPRRGPLDRAVPPREGEPWSAVRYASHQRGDPVYTGHVREGQGRDRRVRGLATVEHASFPPRSGAIPKAARTPSLREDSHDRQGSELHPTGARRGPFRREIGQVRKERALGADARLLEPRFCSRADACPSARGVAVDPARPERGRVKGRAC